MASNGLKMPDEDYVVMTDQEMEYDGGQLSPTVQSVVLPATQIAMTGQMMYCGVPPMMGMMASQMVTRGIQTFAVDQPKQPDFNNMTDEEREQYMREHNMMQGGQAN